MKTTVYITFDKNGKPTRHEWAPNKEEFSKTGKRLKSHNKPKRPRLAS